MKKSIIFFIVPLFLAGCDQAKIDDLQKKLDYCGSELMLWETETVKQSAKIIANHEHWSREVSIIQGCEFIFPTCPRSGYSKEALQAIYSGEFSGYDLIFYYIIFIKLFGLFVLLIGAVWSIPRIYFSLKTQHKKLSDAQVFLQNAENLATKARDRTLEYESRLSAMRTKETTALYVLSELEADISKATKKLETVKKELEDYEKLKKLAQD